MADALLRPALAAAEQRSQRIEIAAYTLVLSESLAMQGRVVEAESVVAGVRAEDGSTPQQCLTMERRWFDALRERGDHDNIAIRVIPTTAAPGLAELGASTAMFLAETTGRVQLLEGDWASALINFDRLGLAAEQFSVHNPVFAPWRDGRCSALAELGRHDEGADLADENLRLAREFGSPINIAAALAVKARFQSSDQQIVLLEEAVAAVAGTNAELLRCNLLIDLGFARHHSGDAAAARVALRDGADQATRLGLTRLAGVAGRGLLACGARPRRLQTSGVKSLTPAEQRVVRLAADGHTNSAIATELFINMKTVESHLTRVYKKLRITDRAELKAALRSDRVDLFEVSKAG
jgi:DNA-binding NarL/FixJ family response regulator